MIYEALNLIIFLKFLQGLRRCFIQLEHKINKKRLCQQLFSRDEN